jgi:exodeoxyribonuclease VIII
MNRTLIPGVPMADYLAIDALSSGACKALATGSPYAWRNRIETASPAMSLGTLAHLAILEPARFADAVVQPDVDLRTNSGKETLLDWLVALVGEPTVVLPPKAATGTILDIYLTDLRPRLEASGLLVLTEDQRSLCLGMREAVLSRPHTRALLDADGQCESTGRLTDPEYGVPIKVRPDKLLSGAPVIVSFKTCQSVADRDYLRTAWTYGWHGAAWFYARALEQITGEPHRLWELAIESAPPHDVLLLEYTAREIEEGEAMMRRGMDTYRRCMEAGVWPGAGWDWNSEEYTIRPMGRQETMF